MPRHFPHWLKAYLQYTAQSEAPDSFHFWTGVSTIAGALQRKVWQDQLIFQWIPNFYIIFVAPAGVATKSTTLNFGMGLLEKVPGVVFGPESGSWQGLGDALADATSYFKYQDPIAGEVTVPQSSLTIAASELGTFLRPDDEHAVSFLTDAWDGRRRKFIHKTKHSGGIEIPSPCLNIIGATTPSWLQRNMKENMIRDGLLSRVVFVYAETKRHYVSLPARNVKTSVFYDMGQKLAEDLTEISKMAGSYEFTKDVEAVGGWMDQWYSKHHGSRATHLASDRYGGYIARKQTHLVKLAMVLAASKREVLTITKEDLEEANMILTDAEASMVRVFDSVGSVDEARHVAELMQFVRVYRWLTAADLYRLCHNIMTEKDFKQALRLAIEGDLLEVTTQGGKRGVQPKQGTIH